MALSVDDVEVLDVARSPVADAATQLWPCPSCEQERPLPGAWTLRVRNRRGSPMERTVMVCAACGPRFGGEDPAPSLPRG